MDRESAINEVHGSANHKSQIGSPYCRSRIGNPWIVDRYSMDVGSHGYCISLSGIAKRQTMDYALRHGNHGLDISYEPVFSSRCVRLYTSFLGIIGYKFLDTSIRLY